MIDQLTELKVPRLAFFSIGIPSALLALAWIYFLITLPHYTLLLRSIGLSLALIIVLHLALTTAFIKAGDATTHVGESTTLLFGIALIFIGGAWLSWAVFQGMTSSDWEYYGILGALIVAAQGCISVFLVYQKSQLTV